MFLFQLKLYKILVKHFSSKETPESLKKKLQTFHHHWFDYSTDENDGHIIKNYLEFLGKNFFNHHDHKFNQEEFQIGYETVPIQTTF